MSLKDFEVYQLAIEFLRLANEISQFLPRGQSELKEQLKRASLSIVLNTAEGAGKYSQAEQKRHYTMARGSAFECYAVVDAARALGLIDGASSILDNSVGVFVDVLRWGWSLVVGDHVSA